MKKAPASPSPIIADRALHLKHGRRLEYFTLGWNALEAAVAIGAGLLRANNGT
jgi:hypothetical protein